MTRKRLKEISIDKIDSLTEAVLYFFRFILIKHFIKVIIFTLLITGFILGMKVTHCSTSFFKLEKEPSKIPFIDKGNK